MLNTLFLLFSLISLDPSRGPIGSVIDHIREVKQAVYFPHQMHQLLEDVECNTCHHKEPATKCSKCHVKIASPNPSAKDAYHGKCRDCHAKMKAKDETRFGRLSSCAACHQGK